MKIKFILISLIFFSFSYSNSLDSLYQLAKPGDGYDKLLVLDSFIVYDGGFSSETGKKSCVRGYGAIIDLSLGNIHSITASSPGTVLDIERCVILNSEAGKAALDYSDTSSGQINHVTVAGNHDGIRFWDGKSLDVKNSIIVSNRHYGVLTIDRSIGAFRTNYNDLWNNKDGNYMALFIS